MSHAIAQHAPPKARSPRLYWPSWTLAAEKGGKGVLDLLRHAHHLPSDTCVCKIPHNKFHNLRGRTICLFGHRRVGAWRVRRRAHGAMGPQMAILWWLPPNQEWGGLE